MFQLDLHYVIYKSIDSVAVYKVHNMVLPHSEDVTGTETVK